MPFARISTQAHLSDKQQQMQRGWSYHSFKKHTLYMLTVWCSREGITLLRVVMLIHTVVTQFYDKVISFNRAVSGIKETPFRNRHHRAKTLVGEEKAEIDSLSPS